VSGPAISSPPQHGLTVPGRVILSVVLAACAIPGMVGTAFMIPQAFGAASTWTWPERECEILKSTVAEVEGDGDEVRWVFSVAYRYEVDGAPHVSRAFRREAVTFATRVEAQRLVDAYPAGSRRTCRVDRRASDRAVLAPSAAAPVAWLLLPLALAVGPLVGVVALWKVSPARARKRWDDVAGVPDVPAAAQATGVWSAEPVLLPIGGRSGRGATAGSARHSLAPRSGPVTRFVGVTVVALFWNGIVSVFLSNLAAEWSAGKWPIFSSLFLTPFALIGLGLIGGVGYSLLACFNPRPRLELGKGALTVGGSTSLRWRLGGRAARVTGLTLTLEGREETTYTQGTDTRTDTQVFYRATLVTAANPWDVASGETRLEIPDGTMHSFTAAHNRIRWVVAVHGDIPRWPDVKEEIEIQVLPAPVRREAA
jgi:hypothetical protein